ncbi:hypothetical protein WA026_011434 [Henosepilachna vigintioctopunctata]|uniref:AB hydrolase-1 domain-containing protein n=1 Tax=Henosepilachna vigintioctopunctata TaxID=420089 RepID=A0AAW1TJJ6_9CUCU
MIRTALTRHISINGFLSKTFLQNGLKCQFCSSINNYKCELMTIGSQKINYLKVGNGPKNILCCPGNLGTIWTDFKPQIEGLDKNKFTIVVLDPPGHGGSRPPERVFTAKFYEEDGHTAYELMQNLGLKPFSILGWSDGGVAAIFLAEKYPEAVDKLIIWGTFSYILEEERELYEKLRDISRWPEHIKAPFIKVYGEEVLQNMQNSWYNAIQEIYKNNGDICRSIVKNIKCPTLILHGDKDHLIYPEHPKYFMENIKDARIHHFPEGKHNIHIEYAEEFNNLVTNFILHGSKS